MQWDWKFLFYRLFSADRRFQGITIFESISHNVFCIRLNCFLICSLWFNFTSNAKVSSRWHGLSTVAGLGQVSSCSVLTSGRTFRKNHKHAAELILKTFDIRPISGQSKTHTFIVGFVERIFESCFDAFTGLFFILFFVVMDTTFRTNLLNSC